jgi:nitroreductase
MALLGFGGPLDWPKQEDQTVDATKQLRTLRSLRRFAPEPIPDDVLTDIPRVARWTGSSKNDQPWELIVVREPASLEALSKLDQYAGHLAGARVGIVLAMESGCELDAPRTASWTPSSRSAARPRRPSRARRECRPPASLWRRWSTGNGTAAAPLDV